MAWLELAGHERITLLDNASTYPPLLEFYEVTPHRVLRLGQNLGSRAIWLADMVPNEPFVYTDPDLVPIEACPLDAVQHLYETLQRYPDHAKAGLGLFLDDVPPDLDSLLWERSLVSHARELEPGVYSSLIDTTFALYPPRAPFNYNALRLGTPYQARHTSWYGGVVSDEDRYYLDRATPGPTGSSWAMTHGG